MGDQVAEYEAQLADIESLLELDPSDADTQKLKADLVELIALTRSELAADGGTGATGTSSSSSSSDAAAAWGAPAAAAAAAAPSGTEAPVATAAASQGDAGDGDLRLPPDPLAAAAPAQAASPIATSTGTNPEQFQIPDGTQPPPAAAAAAAASSLAKEKKTTKKSSKPSVPTQFEVPAHLQPLPSDTDGERKKKTRAIKALKSKWRERTKEVQTIEKQKSWKDFVSGGKRKKKRKGVKAAGEGSIFATEDGVTARTGVTKSGDRKRPKY
mmetsp:Transcript_20006/g.43649  ORF Transcript_20006/g.43649 Transcript_20006/m.43649 type:complete len:270 (+) Transcript_20006:46-855(+)